MVCLLRLWALLTLLLFVFILVPRCLISIQFDCAVCRNNACAQHKQATTTSVLVQFWLKFLFLLSCNLITLLSFYSEIFVKCSLYFWPHVAQCRSMSLVDPYAVAVNYLTLVLIPLFQGFRSTTNGKWVLLVWPDSDKIFKKTKHAILLVMKIQ